MEGDEDYAGNFGQAMISIHALRVEGDDADQHNFRHVSYFYPRPPGGGRRSRIAGSTS